MQGVDYVLTDPENVRNKADIGGGGLYDIGCYPIVTSRFLFGAEPTRVVGLIERDPVLKIDRLASAILDFPTGQASFTCSTQLVPYQRMQILGTKGRIEVEIPFNAPPDKTCSSDGAKPVVCFSNFNKIAGFFFSRADCKEVSSSGLN